MRELWVGTAMFAAVLVVAPAKAAAGHCAAIVAHPAFATKAHCAETKAGAIVGDTPDVAALVPAIDAAEQLFTRHFEAPARPIAIVRSMTVPAQEVAALEAMGFVMLPWIDRSNALAQLAATVRQQVEAQASHLPVEAREAAIAKALAQLPRSNSPEQGPSQAELGALSHEIGHMWFRQMFDGQKKSDKPQYGSSAPDWLDEAAAVLAENETLTTTRRTQLRAADKLVPLARWFTMAHPMFDVARGMSGHGDGGGRGTGTTIRVLSGAEAKAMIEKSGATKATDFYTQTRGFVDFLIETSGDQRVFARIAAAMTGGMTIDQWLMRDGKRFKLPNTVKALDARWMAWLAAQKAGNETAP